MTLEQQTVSREIAQKLKELGVKKDSLYYWYAEQDEKPRLISEDYHPSCDGHEYCECGSPCEWANEKDEYGFCYHAYTVAELGELLPWEIEGRTLRVAKCADGSWMVFYEKNNLGFPMSQKAYIEDQAADTEADARGKMLIYLLENKLITLP